MIAWAVLSLPALGYLRDAGVGPLWLHTSDYASAIGEWARHNGIVTGIWPASEPLPAALAACPASERWALSLFHGPEVSRAFRSFAPVFSLGPRSRLSALWTYHKSLSQHRSRVEKSEMHYNVDLARAFVRERGLREPDFCGLPALKIPDTWKSPEPAAELLIVASNGGSAHNWPMSRYIARAREAVERESKSVQFLIHGVDAEQRKLELEASDLADRVRVLPSFSDLKQLIAHIAACGEVLSSSTGPLHIAHAAGRPVTGLFPKMPRVQSFQRWRPDGYWHTAPIRWEHI